MANYKQFLGHLFGKSRSASTEKLSSTNESRLSEVPISRRELSEQEMSWAVDILGANPDWATISVGQLWAVAKCPCGDCKSIKLERPSSPQNPQWTDRVHGENRFLRCGFPVGSAYLQAKNHGLVQVMLFTDAGFLDWLDVVSLEPGEGDHVFKPLPETIEELSRSVSAD